MKKPFPVSTGTVCSECGLDWSLHKEASFRECIRLLKAQPRTVIQYPTIQPLVQPYPVYPNRPWWDRGYTWTCGQTSGTSSVQTINTANTRSITAA